jgi:membrane-bound serine protease (ClpP class)
VRDTFINYVSDPQVASLLLTIGIFGLIFGFLTPGFYVPETAGAILIIVALYGLSFIDVNAAGVLLLALAFMFFIVEALTPTFGFWTIAAVITFIFGITLIPTDEMVFYMPESWFITFRVASIVVAVVVTAFFAYALFKVVQAKKMKPRIGRLDLVGERGVAVTPIAPKGQIRLGGEIWKAESDEPVDEGDEVEVVGQNRLTLRVKRLAAPQNSAAGPQDDTVT